MPVGGLSECLSPSSGWLANELTVRASRTRQRDVMECPDRSCGVNAYGDVTAKYVHLAPCDTRDLAQGHLEHFLSNGHEVVGVVAAFDEGQLDVISGISKRFVEIL